MTPPGARGRLAAGLRRVVRAADGPHRAWLGAVMVALAITAGALDATVPAWALWWVALAGGVVAARPVVRASLRRGPFSAPALAGGARPVAPGARLRRVVDRVPALAGALVGGAAAINLLSVLTPDMADRMHALRQLLPREALADARSLSLSTSALLLAVALPLARRRRRAWAAAVVLLIAVGVFDVVKGLDVEEAIASWTIAGLLVAARGAFCVPSPPLRLAAALGRVAALATGAFALGAWAVSLGLRSEGLPAGPGRVAGLTASMLAGGRAGVRFGHHYHWLHQALPMLGLVALLGAALMLTRPLRQAVGVRASVAAPRAHALMRRYGSGTLGFFTLRADHRYLFSGDGRAYLAYQVENGTLTVAGDPVGADDAVPGLLADLAETARRQGLRLAAVGVGQAGLARWRAIGLRPIYLGDEAVVRTAEFSLEGRPIRKVRQSVNRLERAGYGALLRPVRELAPADLAELEAISARWRGGRPERGFSMALDALGGPLQEDCLVLLAVDGEGRTRGFLHFAPAYGRPAMSLAFMRRDPDTPNGLTEFMVATALVRMRALGVEEVSLNFATFGRLLREPRGHLERLLGRIIRGGDRWFQISSLLAFNGKFFPRWEPRYILCEGALAAPATGLAMAWLEGQLPRPRWIPGGRGPAR